MKKNHIKLILVATLLLQSPAYANPESLALPDMGDASATILSADEDQRLGQAFMRSLRQHVNIIEDPAINAYVNTLGYRLLGGANTELPFTFFVVDDPNINAFAGPGGYIGIHSGLILTATTEGEVAAVMAHEVAHVTQRHLARAFKKASATNLQAAAAVLAAIILGSPQIGEAAIALAVAAPIQQQLNFTRAHEKEADRVGIEILANAGYDPRHMPAFFYRLQTSQRYMKSNLPELLRTHPVTPSRISDSKNRAEQYLEKEDYFSNADFGLIQARLHSLSSDEKQRIQAIELSVNKNNSDDKTRYEYALWKLNQGEYAAARKMGKQLLNDAADQALYIALMAQIEVAEGEFKQAENRLEQALALYPQHPLLTMQYVEVLLQLGRPEIAAKKMKDLIQHLENFALPADYQRLAKAETAANLLGNAHQTLAEYYYLIGLTRIAIDQLEVAQKETPTKDHFNHAKIKARLEELKQMTLEEEQAKRKQ